ncbi:cordon-bleu protein-like 1 [Sparus aurata]|uniref:cordon-bleu protein-like 1 n=1 Tax=Sparus aurata TaxID=8175 RepID=UPI0011C1CC10|nr:cordon-bleu protein-like 1 [Sparus aurata]
MEEQVNLLEIDHNLCVVLPGGLEKNVTVHGSKPVMDLLVNLCASYHLNPSDYTVEVLSPNKNNISFKPNSPIGSLEAERVVLKPRGVEEKIRRPYMPEASVRLLINYNKSHKAVVRVSPRVPLEMLLSVVCDKCEFKVETTVLLRDSQSQELLDLTKTLNELGLREVFAKDTAENQQQPRTPEASVSSTEATSPPPLQELPKREKKQKENRGFLSLFRRGKKKCEGGAIPPASPGHHTQVGVSMNGQSSNTMQADVPKKRRAPQPPMGASQSLPNNLSTYHLMGAQRSADSTLRRTKRRAPLPPSSNSHQQLQADEVKGILDSMNTVEELRESDESDSVNLSLSSPSSPHPSHPWSSSSYSRPSLSHFHEMADPYLPSFRGKDLSDARSALAKVLTSSVSKGALVKRFRKSATLTKLHSPSSYMFTTQRYSNNEVVFAELEPVITSSLPTEPQWQDPVQRKGMTTFKVVPSKKKKSHDPELTLDVPDQYIVEDNLESEGSRELADNQTETEADQRSPARSETEADPCSSVRSETEADPRSPDRSETEADPCSSVRSETEEDPRSPDRSETEADPCSSVRSETEEDQRSPDRSETEEDQRSPDRSETEEAPRSPDRSETEDDPHSPGRSETEIPSQSPELCSTEIEVSPPPPVDLDDQDCPCPPLSDVEDAKQKGEDEPEVTSEVIPATPSDCSEEELPTDGQINSEDQSEFLQSSVSSDIDQCSSYTDEEEVVQEEEEEEEEGDIFPPPPSPIFFNEDTEEESEDTVASSLPSSHPPTPSSNGPANTFTEDLQYESSSGTPEESAAAPKPPDKMSSAPSRFAQAVALAVQRSRFQRLGKGSGPQAPSGPQSTLPSPPRTLYQFGA